MPKPLVFMMGRSPVFLPVDREYARNHMWAVRGEEGYRLGFTAFAVKLLGEIRCVQWSVAPGTSVEEGRAIGFVEASKATSDVYIPLSGDVIAVNSGVLVDPSVVNSHPYDAGWLVTVAGRAASLLEPRQYADYLKSAWPLAQRLLKGQVGGKP